MRTEPQPPLELSDRVGFDFGAPDAQVRLDALDDAELDQLDFGVIRMSPEARVVGYNHYESRAAGLGKDRVLGRHFFTEVAPCTNNYLVSGRFDDAALDDTLPYVFTLRMRPTPVKLRLLKQPGAPYQYVLVLRGGS